LLRNFKLLSLRRFRLQLLHCPVIGRCRHRIGLTATVPASPPVSSAPLTMPAAPPTERSSQPPQTPPRSIPSNPFLRVLPSWRFNRQTVSGSRQHCFRLRSGPTWQRASGRLLTVWGRKKEFSGFVSVPKPSYVLHPKPTRLSQLSDLLIDGEIRLRRSGSCNLTRLPANQRKDGRRCGG
jgi:hypothetical protein